jgi:hypothetical protein
MQDLTLNEQSSRVPLIANPLTADGEKISGLPAGFCGEISRLAISGLRKKLADSTSANPLILDSILSNLH